MPGDTVLEGTVLEGTVLEGTVLEGIVLEGIVLEGIVLEGIVLEDTVLEDTVAGGTSMIATSSRGVFVLHSLCQRDYVRNRYAPGAGQVYGSPSGLRSRGLTR